MRVLSFGLPLVEEMRSPVGRPDFKSGRGRYAVFGGFDSHSLSPIPLTAEMR
jgi:hypothetical protein